MNEQLTTTLTVNRETLAILLSSLKLKKNSQNNTRLLQLLATEFDIDYVNGEENSLPLNYPYMSYLEIAKTICEQLYNEYENIDKAYEQLGYDMTQVYFQTMAGQVIKALATIIGPINGAKQIVKILSTRLPWASHELEEVYPGYLRYRIKNLPGSHYIMRGILRGSLAAGGAKNILITTTTLISNADIIHEAYWVK